MLCRDFLLRPQKRSISQGSHSDWKTWENGKAFSSQGILNRLEKSMNEGFPLGLENLEKWEGIFQSRKSQRILNRLEKSGKITQNTGKPREFEIKII